jgi:uncharacterized protein
MLFAVIRHDHPASLALRMSVRPKHFEYLQTVLHQIIYGGALLDGQGKQVGSMLIIDAVDQASADAFADADPFVEANLFASSSVEPFCSVFQDGARIDGGPA